jgi:hypothetical protein
MDTELPRYYVESLGGRGWPKCHFVIDRSTEPHTVVGSGYEIAKRATAVRLCARLNELAGPHWKFTPNERDSLTRLRDWAAQTKAFTESAYDPNAEPALVSPEALRYRGPRLEAA